MRSFSVAAVALGTAAVLSTSTHVVQAQAQCKSLSPSAGEPAICIVGKDECCPGLECVSADTASSVYTCQLSASTEAAMAHVVNAEATSLAQSLTDALDKASAKIALAEKDLAKLKKQAKEKADATQSDAQKTIEEKKADAQKAMEDKKDEANDLITTAKEKALLVKQQVDELFNSMKEKLYGSDDTTAVDTKTTNHSKSTKLKGGKKKANAKEDKVADSSAGGSSVMTGGFDYQKFVPGGASGVGGTGMTGTGMTGTGMTGAGGMDWKAFVPAGMPGGAGPTAHAASLPSLNASVKESTQAAPATPATPATPGQPAQAAEGEKGGPCGKTNFKKFKDCSPGLKCTPAGPMSMGWAPGTCEVDAPTTNSAADTAGFGASGATGATAGSASKPAGSMMPGEEGGPCGQSSFTHFGDCDKGLVCKAADSSMGAYMPSKCAKPTADAPSTPATANSVSYTDISSYTSGGFPGTGKGLGVSNATGGYVPSYGVPSVFSPSSGSPSSSSKSSKDSKSSSGSSGSSSSPMWDKFPGMPSTLAMFATPSTATSDDSPAAAAAAYAEATTTADEMDTLVKAATDAVEALHAQLATAVDQLQASANKLRTQAEEYKKQTTGADMETVQAAAITSQEDESATHHTFIVSLMAVGVVAGAFVLVRNKMEGGYQSI